MNVRHTLQDLATRLLRTRGWQLSPLPSLPQDNSMDGALRRLARLNLPIQSVIDVGAAAGTWTRRALTHFPEARYLLVEPLQERVEELTRLRNEYPSVDFVSAVAGETPGEVNFTVASDLDGSGVYDGSTDGRKVPMTTLDQEAEKRALPGSYLIKLDTHGFELPILKGATHSLSQTAALVIEVYNFTLSAGSLRFHELCSWLEEKGFRCCDLVEPMRRPSDGALWQMDLVFVRKDAPVFSRDIYQ